MFFQNWSDIVHTLVVGTVVYVVLVVFLRVTGKRTLAKLNAFDFIVTVAFGSTVASALLSSNTSALQAATALLLLILLQFVVAWLETRSRFAQRIVKATPRLLLEDGRMLESALRAERVAAEEVLQAVRGAGYSDLAKVGFVVLETDGTLSVMPPAQGVPSALANVPYTPPVPVNDRSRRR